MWKRLGVRVGSYPSSKIYFELKTPFSDTEKGVFVLIAGSNPVPIFLDMFRKKQVTQVLAREDLNFSGKTFSFL